MLTTLLQPRKPQRASYVGAATNRAYAAPRASFIVAPGALAGRGVRSVAYTQFDMGLVLSQPLSSRQHGWSAPPPPAQVRSSGFLLALQGVPRPVPSRVVRRDEYFTLYIPPPDAVAPAFPTQYAGLRYFHGSVRELCLVAEADAPSGMGGVWKVNKNGTTYAVYLVDTGDANASPIRVRTTTGTKAARNKT